MRSMAAIFKIARKTIYKSIARIGRRWEQQEPGVVRCCKGNKYSKQKKSIVMSVNKMFILWYWETEPKAFKLLNKFSYIKLPA